MLRLTLTINKIEVTGKADVLNCDSFNVNAKILDNEFASLYGNFSVSEFGNSD
jgi:hypothetical protein